MKKFFIFEIAASLLLMLNVNMNAQDPQNPWHLITFVNEKEDAFYNTEMITDIEANAQSVTIVLGNGKKFSYSTVMTTFSFEPRKEGTATINENIIVPQWKVNYANNRLYFHETVSNVFVYTINGVLVSKFTGKFTEAFVHLPSGIYIVHADGKSTKLLVNNESGSTFAQSDNKTRDDINTIPASINLRMENSINEYWNITANNSTLSIRISDVKKFSFNEDNSLEFILKNGATLKLSDYQGIKFTIEPVDPTNVIKNDYYQGASGYVRFNYLNTGSLSNYRIGSIMLYNDPIFKIIEGEGELFYLDKIDDTRYLIRAENKSLFPGLYDSYLVPAIFLNLGIDINNIGKFTVLDAKRNDDTLKTATGKVIDLKKPNDFTYTFTQKATMNGRSYYTINTEIVSDLSMFGFEGNTFLVDVDFAGGYLRIRSNIIGINNGAFAIEEVK